MSGMPCRIQTPLLFFRSISPQQVGSNSKKTFTISASSGGSGGGGDSGGGSSGGGGCFIATACYGTPLAEEVKTLCAIRDRYLVTNPVGRSLVNFYYIHSPKMADFIRDKEHLKAFVRAGLKPIIWIIREMLNFETCIFCDSKKKASSFNRETICIKSMKR